MSQLVANNSQTWYYCSVHLHTRMQWVPVIIIPSILTLYILLSGILYYGGQTILHLAIPAYQAILHLAIPAYQAILHLAIPAYIVRS